jgi:type II secretory pathway pseudopilin PulG
MTMTKEVLPGNCRGVCVKRLGNHADARRGDRRHYNAFTLIELVVVFGLIIVLTGLVLSTVGYARKKGARARAETEIAAMSAACESYKADNGAYPFDANTNLLTATNTDSSTYSAASLSLYKFISGDSDADRVVDQKTYFTFKPNMLAPPGGTGPVTAILDPFGNSYGYSTSKNPVANPNADTASGYNPTFDLWSTANSTDSNQWIKNW